MVRISSAYASLRVEGVGQSQGFTGWTILRNGITHITSVMLGTVVYQSWSTGSNNFYQPITFGSGPRLQSTNDNGLAMFCGNNQAFKAMTLEGSDGHVVAHLGFHNDSDARLKDDVQDLPSNDCLSLLKSVSAKSYVRNDLQDTNRRAGFIAQEVEAALAPSLGQNLVGTRELEGGQTSKTLAYDRMAVVLWQCCRSLLARVEELEARLP